MDSNVMIAFMLTMFAGLATGIGGLFSVFVKTENKKFLAVSLGFSAGVMLYVSFVEIFAKANEFLEKSTGEMLAPWLTVLGFFFGMLFIGIIDKLLERKKEDEEKNVGKANLLRMGMFTALAIGIHNFPEGLVTFMAALEDPGLGIAIAIAIAIHNVPEEINQYVLLISV